MSPKIRRQVFLTTSSHFPNVYATTESPNPEIARLETALAKSNDEIREMKYRLQRLEKRGYFWRWLKSWIEPE